MVLYRYKSKDAKGSIVAGRVEADSEVQAAEILEEHGLSPLKFEISSGGIDSLDELLKKFSSVSAKEMVMFFRQLSTLVGAQVRIVKALQILVKQVNSPKFKIIIEKTSLEVEGGKSLSDAFAINPDIFPELYTSLVRAGEASGSLDKTLIYLADQIEKDYDLKSKIRGALAYPAFIILLLFAVGGLMFFFVLPQMTGVLLEAGAELPFATKIIIGATNFVTGYWWVVLILMVTAIFGFRYMVHTEKGRYVVDRIIIKLPIVGKFLQTIYIYRFSHHIANLLDGGINIVKSLQLVAGITGNWVYRDLFLDASKEVQTGKQLNKIFENSSEIPPLVAQMVAVGEETGDLPGILRKLSEFYDKQLENTISTMTTLIEPVIMVILGLAVGIMVAGILLPIYNLASTF
ncbi:MAG: hypothetical protein COT91_00525 [Candidatus Doudnabacteria bacterium CG10_big_fil_rev_8_21_14_0_10_41_10]|uniref:Type II secretion system protein GspF domain-containing protein n=1 Tax=Candidatus Doudnabacteria bacterium CG10_big_fil_rev_8_21_14_0_10_41_10 TaxID=1974551 RepID=A0A2H0VEW6_9BACT|nr:MAG: hypothetical protein COT91_00525 [Candidatus Doudnabacteria bacterium CG10_big_fil_rev_8_21_14_0_10_41_10]